MPKVLVQPARGRKEARDRFRSTIERPVPIQEIRNVLKRHELEDLKRISSDAVRIWGLARRKNGTGESIWRKLQIGDVVLFTGGGHAIASDVVAAKIQNRALAEQLWGTTEDDTETWEFIYVLEGDFQDHRIPYVELNKRTEYRSGHNYPEAILLDEFQSERVLNLLERSHMPVREDSVPTEESEEQRETSAFDEESPGPALRLPDDKRLDEAITRIRQRLEIDPRVIRDLVAHLVAGRHVILVGPTGNGKTELACRISDEIFRIAAYVVTATADWTGHEVIGGPFPVVREEGGSQVQRFVIRPGCVYQALKLNLQPSKNGAQGTWLVIDELNRAEVDKAFGELFTAMDQGWLRVPRIGPEETDPPTELIKIPDHFRIIGTMNSADRHYLFRLSDALKRRFAFVWLGLPGNPEAERTKVIQRVRENLERRELPNDSIQQSPARIETIAAAMYELLGFLRVFYPVGVAQAIATLEYAAVRSELGGASREACLEGGLLANVVPQLEGVHGRQLRLLRHCTMGEPERMLRDFAAEMEAEPAGPFYDVAGFHDLREVIRYLKTRCSGAAKDRAEEIGDLLERPDIAERQNELRTLLDGGRDGPPDGGRPLADLVEEQLELWPLPDLATRLDELAADAGGRA